MKTFPDVSVIIPVLNGEKVIIKCLNSIKRQDYSGNIEIIVVNDGSTDETSVIVRIFEGVTLIDQPNLGRSVARNNGVKRSTGEILAFTDADCEPSLDWITRLVKRLLDSTQSGIVSGAMIVPDNSNIWLRIDHQAWAHSITPASPPEKTIFGWTSNMCVRRAVFDLVGGFDKRLWGSEDSDLAFRIHKNGGHNFFTPDAVVTHHPCRSSFRSFIRQRYNYGKWTIQTVLKHKPLPPYSWIFPNNRLLLGVLWPFYAIAATVFTFLRVWNNDKSVLWMLPFHFVGRVVEYIGTIVGCAEFQRKKIQSE